MDEQAPDKTPATEPTPVSAANESKLDAAKQKLASLAEKAKEHDFKGDARKAVEGVKNLKKSLKTHDFKTELRDAFAETKKNPASIWKKPETLRPGKDLAVVGLVASVVLLLLLLVTSNSLLGLVCLIFGLGALLFSALGLKTEGRKLAVGGSVVGLLVVFCALGQTFGSSEEEEEEVSVASAVAGGANAPSDRATVAAKLTAAHSKKKKTPMVGSNPKDYPVLVANEGKKTGGAKKIIEKAPENAAKLNSLNFFGFHTGMSFADFKTLREHYGLNDKQIWCYFNVENGEVYRMCFTTKALGNIAGWPNNFETVEIQMLLYFGIVDWNNIKDVIEGEIDSLFQDEGDKLFFGDRANVPRQYRTADGVVAKLFPKGWDKTTLEVFDILDPARQKPAAPLWRQFEQKNRMRQCLKKLKAQGVKAKMMQLPNGYEWLLREFDDGVWISAFPMKSDEFAWLFHDGRISIDLEKSITTGNGFADAFNALPTEAKGSIVRFREPFPEEMRKAFSDGIVNEKEYKAGYKFKPFNKAFPAIIVGDEASSEQLERMAMYVIHGFKSMETAAFKKYNNKRTDLIRQGKSGDELVRLGYGMALNEWKDKCQDQATLDYIEENRGVISDGLTFFTNYSKAEREAFETEKRAEREAFETKKRVELEAKEAPEKEKQLIENNHAQCEAVKKTLDAANIENTIIELPKGVHLLMTRVNLTVGEEKIDWASTFEVTVAQCWAVLTEKEHWDRSWIVPNPKHGELPDADSNHKISIPGNGIAYQSSVFINDLNSIAPDGWKFRLASDKAWDALSGGVRFQPDSLEIRPNTLENRQQGKKLDNLKWKTVPLYNPTSSFESQSKKDAAVGSLRPDEMKAVGNGTPNYYGLCDMLGNAIELNQPIWGHNKKVGRSKDGAMRLVATYTPPEQSVAAGAEKTPAPTATKNNNAQ